MDVRLYVNGGECFAVSFEGLSLWPDEEFLKVPRDVCPPDGTPNQKFGVLHERDGVVIGIGELVFKIGKNRMCVGPIDITFLKDGKVGLKAAARTHMLQGIHDLTIAAVLLQNTSVHLGIVIFHTVKDMLVVVCI